MKTLLIDREEELDRAVSLLKAGELAAVPTETVYGLCADGLNAEAVEKLYEIKGRPEVKPLALMIPSAGAMAELAREVPPAALTLADAFWPGPLTLILPARTKRIPSVVRAGGDTIGLRCPDHPMTLSLLRRAGFPLAGPSANPSGMPAPVNAEEVLGYFDGRIAAVVDGGTCGFGEASTILDMTKTPYTILRRGALGADEIEKALSAAVTRIGLTGGTGSGKTTVLRYLERRGALGLDCDEIYHELLENSAPMLNELRRAFPDAFVSGQLDRKALGRLVFADSAALLRLNEITHRYVKEEVERRIAAFAMHGGRLAVIDAIALFESGLAEPCRMTVGVTAPAAVRLQRIMDREGIGAEYAQKRIDAQKDNTFFAERCTRVLVNDGTPAELEAKCAALYEEIEKTMI